MKPGAVDDAVIGNAFAGTTIAFDSGTSALNSVTSAADLKLSGGTLSVAAASQIDTDFGMSGGTLSGGGAITVGGVMTWTGGTIHGSGTTVIPVGAALNISGSSIKTIREWRIENFGVTAWSEGTIRSADGAVFHNEVGATLELTGDNIIQKTSFSGSNGIEPAIINDGLLRKSAGSGRSRLNLLVDNNGTFEVNTGILEMDLGGTSGGGFHVAAGATLEFGGGTHNVILDAGKSISGAGNLVFSGGGTTNFSGEGTVDITGEVTIETAADINFNRDVTFPQLTLQDFGSVLGGAATVTITGVMSWTGGTIHGSGTMVIPGGALLNISGTSTKTLRQWTIENFGVTVWSGGTISSADGAVFHNEVGATLELTGDNIIQKTSFVGSNGIEPAIINDGLLRKSAGGGRSRPNLLVDNIGTFEVNTGILELDLGGTSSGGFNVATDATLEFGGGTHNVILDAGKSISGAGNVVFSGGGTTNISGAGTVDITGDVTIETGADVNFNRDVTFARLNLRNFSSTLGGAASVTVTDLLDWNDRASMSGTGGTNISDGATMTIDLADVVASGSTTLQRTVNNAGRVVWQSGDINTNAASVLNNLPTGVFEITSDERLGGNATATVINDGLIVKSGGTGDSEIDTASTVNNGTIEVQTGRLFLNRGLSSLSGTLLIGGSYVVKGGTLKYGSTSLIENIDATVVLDGPTSQFHNADDTDGLASLEAIFPNGHLAVQHGRDFTTAADLDNNGHVTVGPDSKLTVAGTYDQDAGAMLTIGLGGAPASGQFGMLDTPNAIALGGTFEISLSDGFEPAPEDSYQVLTFPSRVIDSVFSDFEGLFVGGTQRFQVTTNASEVVIETLRDNQLPTVSDFSRSTAEETALAFAQSDFINAFQDADGNSLTQIVVTSLPPNGVLRLGNTTVNEGDTIAAEDLSTLSYLPNSDFVGNDEFSWKGSDGIALSAEAASVGMTVHLVNGLPRFILSANVSTLENTPVDITGVSVSDDDSNSLTITIDARRIDGGARVMLPAAESLDFLVFQGNGTGLITIVDTIAKINQAFSTLPEAALVYQPSPDFEGVSSVVFTAVDGDLHKTTATLMVTFTGVNAAPTVANFSRGGDEDSTVVLTKAEFESAYSDSEGDSLATVQITDLPDRGTLLLSGVAILLDQQIAAANLDSLTYAPNENFNGVDSFAWRASDGSAFSDLAATVSLTINPVEDATTFVLPDSATTNEDSPVVLAGASSISIVDVDGGVLSVLVLTNGIVTLNANNVTSLSQFSGNGTGEVLLIGSVDAINEALQSITYQPSANFNGSDNMKLRAGNLGQPNAEAILPIIVTAVNDAPTLAVPAAQTVDEDEMLALPAITIADVDVDPANDVIDVAVTVARGSLSLDPTGLSQADGVATSSLTLQGTLVALNIALSTIVDASEENFHGSDTITFTVDDLGKFDANSIESLTTTRTVNVTIRSVNDRPIATDDAYAVNPNLTLTVPASGVLANDTDVEGDVLSAVHVSSPQNGTLTLNANGSFTYVPNADFQGLDSFQYQANDGKSVSEAATVRILVGNSDTDDIRVQLTAGIIELNNRLGNFANLFDLSPTSLPLIPEQLNAFFGLQAALDQLADEQIVTVLQPVGNLQQLRDAITARGMTVTCVEGEVGCETSIIEVVASGSVTVSKQAQYDDDTTSLLTDLSPSAEIDRTIDYTGVLSLNLSFGVDSSGSFVRNDNPIRLHVTGQGQVAAQYELAFDGLSLATGAESRASTDVVVDLLGQPTAERIRSEEIAQPNTWLTASAAGGSTVDLDLIYQALGQPTKLRVDASWTIPITTTGVGAAVADVHLPGQDAFVEIALPFLNAGFQNTFRPELADILNDAPLPLTNGQAPVQQPAFDLTDPAAVRPVDEGEPWFSRLFRSLQQKLSGVSQSGQGAFQTVGDEHLRSAELRSLTGLTGRGVKIGVISDNVDGLSQAQASHDLPLNVTVMDRVSPRCVSTICAEGTAMLEIIHDVAPEAELYFAGGFGKAPDFIAAATWLRDQGVDIIVDDLGFFYQPWFSDGSVATVVNELVADNNILFVSAAGNDGLKHVQSDFRPTLSEISGLAGTVHNWADDGSIVQVVEFPTLRRSDPSKHSIFMQWSDPAAKYKLVFVDLNVNPAAVITDDHPVLVVREPQESSDRYFVEFFPRDPAPGDDETFRLGLAIQELLPATVSTQPSQIELLATDSLRGPNREPVFGPFTSRNDAIYGHSAAENVLTVGALDAADLPGSPASLDEPADYSSGGPSTVRTDQGLQIARPSLDVMGIAGVQVSGAMFFPSPFFGTSAAAPHVAAIAGLLKQAYGDGATAAVLRQAIRESAVELGVQGYDNSTGYGRVDAVTAFQRLEQIIGPASEVEHTTATTDLSGLELLESLEFVVENPLNDQQILDLFADRLPAETDITRLTLDISPDNLDAPLSATFGFGLGRDLLGQLAETIGFEGSIDARLFPDVHLVVGVDGLGFYLDGESRIGGRIEADVRAAGRLEPFGITLRANNLIVNPSIQFDPTAGKMRFGDLTEIDEFLTAVFDNIHVSLGKVSADLSADLSLGFLDFVDVDPSLPNSEDGGDPFVISAHASLTADFDTLDFDNLDQFRFQWSNFGLSNPDIDGDGDSDYSTPVFVENFVSYIEALVNGQATPAEKKLELKRGKIPVERTPTPDEQEAASRMQPLLAEAANRALLGEPFELNRNSLKTSMRGWWRGIDDRPEVGSVISRLQDVQGPTPAIEDDPATMDQDEYDLALVTAIQNWLAWRGNIGLLNLTDQEVFEDAPLAGKTPAEEFLEGEQLVVAGLEYAIQRANEKLIAIGQHAALTSQDLKEIEKAVDCILLWTETAAFMGLDAVHLSLNINQVLDSLAVKFVLQEAKYGLPADEARSATPNGSVQPNQIAFGQAVLLDVQQGVQFRSSLGGDFGETKYVEGLPVVLRGAQNNNKFGAANLKTNNQGRVSTTVQLGAGDSAIDVVVGTQLTASGFLQVGNADVLSGQPEVQLLAYVPGRESLFDAQVEGFDYPAGDRVLLIAQLRRGDAPSAAPKLLFLS